MKGRSAGAKSVNGGGGRFERPSQPTKISQLRLSLLFSHPSSHPPPHLRHPPSFSTQPGPPTRTPCMIPIDFLSTTCSFQIYSFSLFSSLPAAPALPRKGHLCLGELCDVWSRRASSFSHEDQARPTSKEFQHSRGCRGGSGGWRWRCWLRRR